MPILLKFPKLHQTRRAQLPESPPSISKTVIRRKEKLRFLNL
jgi:hypothetical protein